MSKKPSMAKTVEDAFKSGYRVAMGTAIAELQRIPRNDTLLDQKVHLLQRISNLEQYLISLQEKHK